MTELYGEVKVTSAPTAAKSWNVADLTVSAQESSSITSIAGAVGVGLGYGGVGAAFGFIDNSRSVTTLLSGSLSIASSGHVLVTAGSRLVGDPTNSYRAEAIAGLPDDAFDQSDVDKGGDMNAQMVNIAVAVGGSKMVGIGFNIAKTSINRTISARVASGVSVTLNNDDGDQLAGGVAGQSRGLTVSADDASSIVVVSAETSL